MAHCPYDKLADIEPVLATLRGWEGLREAKPGIFYIRSDGFLHFHIDKEGRRWADVKIAPRGKWQEIPLKGKQGPAEHKAFLAKAGRCYEGYLKAAGK
jgi:hypothetical protein